MYQWHRAPVPDPIPHNSIIEVQVNGRRVAVLKDDRGIYAFSATCPHAGAPLCDGWTDARGRIVCPQHHYRFDPANGRNTSGEGYKLSTYPVKIEEEDIYIGFLPE